MRTPPPQRGWRRRRLLSRASIAAFILASGCGAGRSPTSSADRSTFEVTVSEGIPYTSERTLDVYTPSGAEDLPIVVAYHGGGGSSSASLSSLARAIAQHGVVVFVPNWRAGPTPADELEGGAEDAACAIRFARAHAPDYRAAPDRVVGVGHSGGGWVGALMALAGDEFAGNCLIEEGDGRLDSYVGLEGPYDLVQWLRNHDLYDQGTPEQWTRMSPLTYVESSSARPDVEFRLFVGDLEEAREMANSFHDELTGSGYRSTVITLPGVTHGGIKSGSIEETVEAVVELARD